MKIMRNLPLLATVGLLFLSLNRLKAANYTVIMGPSTLTFNPASITIGQGDTVTWTNAAQFTPHTSTSGSPPGTPNHLWDTGTLSGFGMGSVTFDNFATNTYPYYCTIHGAAMVGSLMVTNAAPEPTPSLSNATLSAGQFHFTIDGLIGQKYAVQSSPDLISWTAIGTNLATSTSTILTNAPAASPTEFYRVLEIQ